MDTLEECGAETTPLSTAGLPLPQLLQGLSPSLTGTLFHAQSQGLQGTGQGGRVGQEGTLTFPEAQWLPLIQMLVKNSSSGIVAHPKLSR